jgi:hypothetical protein
MTSHRLPDPEDLRTLFRDLLEVPSSVGKRSVAPRAAACTAVLLALFTPSQSFSRPCTALRGAGGNGLALARPRAATAGLGAGALIGAYGIPALVNAIYGNTKGNDQQSIKAGGGVVSGANAGMVRLWTPALTKTEANTKEQARKQQESLIAFRSGERTSATGLSTVATTTRAGAVTTAMAQAIAASRIVGAIADRKSTRLNSSH